MPARSPDSSLLRFRSSVRAKSMTSPAISCRSAGGQFRECAHFQAKVAAVVDELAPELAGFPPAVVGVVVAKGDQEAEDQPVENGRLGPPFDVGKMLELDKLVDQPAVDGQQNDEDQQLPLDQERRKEPVESLPGTVPCADLGLEVLFRQVPSPRRSR